MMDRSLSSPRTGLSSARSGRLATGVIAAALALVGVAGAQVTGSSQTTTDAQGQQHESATITVTKPSKKTRESKKDEKVKSTKDTRAEEKKEKKLNPLVGKDADLPDKQLYDKALAQIKSGHFDVARLDLNTLLSTYPDSQYQMRAKLAIADAWYREGGSAALAQAEQEYKDFITFFPNAPEAAEAQMRVGDIYFKQMDVPDRDDKNAQHAEEEYRTMLKQYPDAPKEILKEAQQKLRDVQEVLAQRETDIAAFYASRENWPAALARYETVQETYPQYSHMDDVLIGIGDAYAAEARAVRAQVSCAANLKNTPCLPEGAKSQLEQEFDGKAAAEYREVVLKHAAAPHAEFAKERLAAMNLPIPQPTAEDVAASEALEGSRAQYTMQKRLALLFLRKPDTVTAAQMGDPPLDDPAPVLAPEVAKALVGSYKEALNPGAAPKAVVKDATPAIEPGPGEVPPQPRTPPGQPASNAPALPPTLSDVPAAGAANDTGAPTEMTPASPTGASPSGTGVGVEVLTPGVNTGAGAASSLPSATGAADPNLGLKAVGPKDNSALPPVEAPAAAPDQVNDVAGKQTPPAEAKPAGKKNPKPEFDKNDESSSKHKKKKGADKLNPF
ncbi:MAG TPA: outer membrane protein assembly factor BamD [Acidobacteriaceae bacterium]|nr:outer membrane protein assembly factor BamD [Acidobacteriaceae bacterium]